MEPVTTVTAGIVAPTWLHESLTVLLEAAPDMRIRTCATTVEALLSAPAEEPPDVVLLYAASRRTASQVAEVKSAWPQTHCIVLIEYYRFQSAAKEAGADAILLEGLAAGRLLKTLDSFYSSADRAL